MQPEATFGVALLELAMAGIMLLLFTIMQLLLLLLVGKKVSNSNLSVRLELIAKLPPSLLPWVGGVTFEEQETGSVDGCVGFCITPRYFVSL